MERLLPVRGKRAGLSVWLKIMEARLRESHPGQDQKAGIVDRSEGDGKLALLVAPADIAIAGCNLPGGSAKAEQRDRLLLGEDEIAQLRARQGLITQIVVALDELVPQPRILTVLNRLPVAAG